jgi:hypothetical protein
VSPQLSEVRQYGVGLALSTLPGFLGNAVERPQALECPGLDVRQNEWTELDFVVPAQGFPPSSQMACHIDLRAAEVHPHVVAVVDQDFAPQVHRDVTGWLPLGDRR